MSFANFCAIKNTCIPKTRTLFNQLITSLLSETMGILIEKIIYMRNFSEFNQWFLCLNLFSKRTFCKQLLKTASKCLHKSLRFQIRSGSGFWHKTHVGSGLEVCSSFLSTSWHSHSYSTQETQQSSQANRLSNSRQADRTCGTWCGTWPDNCSLPTQITGVNELVWTGWVFWNIRESGNSRAAQFVLFISRVLEFQLC